MLEGPHLIAEALAAGLTLETLLATEEFLASRAGRELTIETLPAVERVSPDLIDYLSDADSPRGVLAVARLPRGGVDTLPITTEGVYLYVDGMQDPGNLGALVRVAEAFAVTAVALSPGSVHPNHPRALRASAGSLLRMSVACGVEDQALHGHLQSISPSWTALTPRAGAGLEDLPKAGSVVLAVGAEGPGLSDEILARIDRRVTIPLSGQVESLNSTVAAAIALHALRALRSAV